MENDESGSVIRVEINGKTWETRNAGLILGSLGLTALLATICCCAGWWI